MTRLIRFGVGLVSLAAILVGVLWLVAALTLSERTVDETVSADGVTAVVIDTDNANFDIVAVEDSDIRVSGEIRESQRTVRDDVEVEDSTLRVTTTCGGWPVGRCGGDLTVEVPAGLAVQVTSGNGSVSVEGTADDVSIEVDNGRVEVQEAAAVEVESDNGSVTIADVSGDVEVEVDNGPVDIRRVAGSVEVISDNGGVSLAEIGGDLTVETDNGRLVADDLASSRVQVESDNGSVSLSFSGRPESVEVESDNGSVEVRVPDEGLYDVTISTDNGRSDIDVRTDPAADSRISITTDNGGARVGYAG